MIPFKQHLLMEMAKPYKWKESNEKIYILYLNDDLPFIRINFEYLTNQPNKCEISFTNISENEIQKTPDMFFRIMSSILEIIQYKNEKNIIYFFEGDTSTKHKVYIRFFQQNKNILENLGLVLFSSKYKIYLFPKNVENIEIDHLSFLDKTNVQNISIKNSNILGFSIINSTLDSTYLQDCRINDLIFSKSLIKNCQFNVRITDESCKNNNMENNIFQNSTLTTVSFFSNIIKNSQFVDTNFEMCFIFIDNLFQKCRFNSCRMDIKDLVANNFVDCSLNNVSFNRGNFNNTKFINCTIKNCDFTNTNIELKYFRNCKMENNRFPEGF